MKLFSNRYHSSFLDKIYLFDRYYNKYFFRNFILFAFLFVMVYFFSMLLVSLSDLFRKASYNDFVTTKNVLTYYCYLIPQYINDTVSFAYLFSVSYTLGVFYRNREILALVASGVQTTRISLLSIVFAFLLGCMLVMANCWWFPQLLNRASEYNMKLNLTREEQYVNNIQIRDINGLIYFGQYFLQADNTLQNFLIIKENMKCGAKKPMLEEEFPHILSSATVANIQKELLKKQKQIPTCSPIEWFIRGTKLHYDVQSHYWEGMNFVRGNFNAQTRLFEATNPIPFQVLDTLRLDPSSFQTGSGNDINILSISQAWERLRELKSRVEPTYTFFIQILDNKFLKPFYPFFLALFASMIGQFFSRRHVFIASFVISFAIAFCFLICVNIGYSLAKSRVVPVWFGVSFGYLCGAGILFLLYRYRKT